MLCKHFFFSQLNFWTTLLSKSRPNFCRPHALSIHKIQQFYLTTADFWVKTLLIRTHQARNTMVYLTLLVIPHRLFLVQCCLISTCCSEWEIGWRLHGTNRLFFQQFPIEVINFGSLWYLVCISNCKMYSVNARSEVFLNCWASTIQSQSSIPLWHFVLPDLHLHVLFHLVRTESISSSK